MFLPLVNSRTHTKRYIHFNNTFNIWGGGFLPSDQPIEIKEFKLRKLFCFKQKFNIVFINSYLQSNKMIYRMNKHISLVAGFPFIRVSIRISSYGPTPR